MKEGGRGERNRGNLANAGMVRCKFTSYIVKGARGGGGGRERARKSSFPFSKFAWRLEVAGRRGGRRHWRI